MWSVLKFVNHFPNFISFFVRDLFVAYQGLYKVFGRSVKNFIYKAVNKVIAYILRAGCSTVNVTEPFFPVFEIF
jgi:hypothetical protein